MSAFRIHGGRAHFKQRYVRTEKFMREREAQRALLGTNLTYYNSNRLVLNRLKANTETHTPMLWLSRFAPRQTPILCSLGAIC